MIKVTLANPSARAFFQARWKDPITQKVKTRSTKTTIKREAERFSARLEDELNSGDFKPAIATTWEELRNRYREEVSASKAKSTGMKTNSMFKAVERLFNPKMISAVAEPSFISKFATALRQEGEGDDVVVRSVFTVRGHLAELRKVLHWARDLELIKKMPVIRMPKKTAGMKGRPITGEEFERMVDVVKKLKGRSADSIKARDRKPRRNLALHDWDLIDFVQSQFVDGWIHFIKGLHLSSLRLEEAMKLSWTSDKELMVDFSNRRPMFRIQAAHEKGRKFRLLPMTPDFANFLSETPEEQRVGFVFNPLTYASGHRKIAHRPTHQHAGRVVSAIGMAAAVKVNEKKFASAHDLRRAFGYRWSKIVMPKVLQELMRHESIQTTMEFYVGSLAEDAADEVWKAAQRFGNTSGDTSYSESHSEDTESEKSHKNK